MPLEPHQLYPNSAVNVDGSKGFVHKSDAQLTSVVREDGKVDSYTTESVLENGEVHTPNEESNEEEDQR